MLKYYFEAAYDFRGNKKDYSHLFEGLAISEAGDKYSRHQGKYPVISLSLKSGKQDEYDNCLSQLKYVIAEEFDRHAYILDDRVLSDVDKETYKAFIQRNLSDGEYEQSLKFLSRCLEKWYGEKVIILIDEYDVPLEGAFVHGFYDRMVGFIRGLFENTLKTNDSLNFAVITGCLRVSKESIYGFK